MGEKTFRRVLQGLLWAATVFVLSACSPPAGESTTAELGHRIAGTWLGTYRIDGPGSEVTAFISTYHADGTGVTTSARAHGAGDPMHHGLSTLHHIQWEQAGQREIRWRILHFGHDADGHLEYISRTHGVMEFDEGFENCNGTFQVEVFEPNALLAPLDPNNPAVEPSKTARGTNEAKRLLVRIP